MLGTPCTCLACVTAGISDRPTAYVPADERVPKPRWIHGEELRRWWAARDAFWQACHAAGQPKLAETLAKPLRLIHTRSSDTRSSDTR
jgi:hypothetical protein